MRCGVSFSHVRIETNSRTCVDFGYDSSLGDMRLEKQNSGCFCRKKTMMFRS